MGSLLGTMALTALLVTPASASTVRADFEGTGTHVAFADASGEANRLDVRVPPQAGEIRFHDTSSPIEPQGKRCDEVPIGTFRVDCILDGELYFELELDAGPGDDEITSDVDERYGGFKVSFVHILGGAGSDRIDAGRAEDTIDPGPGEDSVRAGGGYDQMAAGPTADGPDRFDGGPAGGTISYAQRNRRTTVRFDGIANDGAAGEGDNAIRTSGAVGGSARDTLTGDDRGNYLFGGHGPDRLRAHGGDDAIMGDAGADRIHAGTGDDFVLDGGSPGVDVIDCGPGRDLYEADPQDETIDCEVPLVGARASKAESRSVKAKS
jgi:Ca2+-binding RTX toxin-like protein